MRVAVAGARGFVGSALCRTLAVVPGIETIPLGRADRLTVAVDVFVNAACPSRRFWAEQNPLGDFTETVTKTAEMFFGDDCERFIQISSISARTQTSTVYGLHRRMGEMIVERDPRSVIARLGPMYGAGHSKNALFDLLNNRPVYVPRATRYAFVDVDWCAARLVDIILAPQPKRLVELGARNSISLGEVAAELGSTSEFVVEQSKVPDDQFILDPDPTWPDAHDVVAWARSKRGTP